MRTHEISEIARGVFSTMLVPCSLAVLPHVLAPDAPHVWVVEHAPDPRLLWSVRPVPLAPTARAEPLRVRGLVYDFQMTTVDFLERVVQMLPNGAGLLLLQLERPVPDSLHYRQLASRPEWHAILRQNGWRLTFDLPHGGEYAAVTSPERGTIERVLADPVIAAGAAAGVLP